MKRWLMQSNQCMYHFIPFIFLVLFQTQWHYIVWIEKRTEWRCQNLGKLITEIAYMKLEQYTNEHLCDVTRQRFLFDGNCFCHAHSKSIVINFLISKFCDCGFTLTIFYACIQHPL